MKKNYRSNGNVSKLKSIRVKMLLATVIVMFLMTSALVGYAAWSIRKNTGQETRDKLLTTVDSLADVIHEKLNGELKYMSSLGRRESVNLEKADKAEITAVLAQEAKNTDYVEFEVFNRNGIALDGSTDVSSREYFQQALQGKVTISDLIVNKRDGSEIFVIAAPVMDGDKVVGVVSGFRPASFVSEFAKSFTYGKTGYAYILNAEGQILGHPDQSLVDQNKTIRELAAADSSY